MKKKRKRSQNTQTAAYQLQNHTHQQTGERMVAARKLNVGN